MLQRLYPAAIFALLLLAAFQWGTVSQLSSDLTTAKESLAACQVELKDSNRKIEEQNLEVTRLSVLSAQLQQESEERSSEVMSDLPQAIERDVASPATADAMNAWMRGMF